jgi:hypothetical protein
MTTILWVGPVVGPDRVPQWRGLSPAANRWQSSFIAALRQGGSCIEVLDHVREPVWPLRPAYLAGIRPALRGGRFDLVVSYNNTTRASHAVGVLAREHGIPWIAIIALLGGIGYDVMPLQGGRDASGDEFVATASLEA